MRRIFTLLCALLMIGMSSLPAAAADQETIKMGTITWEDLLPLTKITKQVLEDKGYKVEVTEFSDWGIAYAALRRGDVQILASQINYAAHDPWHRYKSQLEKLSPVSDGLYQAFAVPSYVDISSIEDLNADAAKFNNRIIGIESGSGLMEEAEKAVQDYGLKLKLIDGSTAAMTAALKSAVDRKDWIVVTLWDPTWMFQKYDMKFLEDPKGIFAPPQAYYWIAQKGFAEQHPHAREVIAGIFVPLKVNRGINTMVNDGMSMDAAVADWMSKNKDVVERWEDVKDK